MDEKVVDLTEVVEEVAKWQYTRFAEKAEGGMTWEEIPAVYKFSLKEAVAPVVVATLKAAGVKTSS